MEILLPEDLQSFVQDQVRSGRFLTKDQVVSEALRRFRKLQDPAVAPPKLDPLASAKVAGRM